MSDSKNTDLAKVSSTPQLKDEKAAIACFSQLHPPFLLSLESVISGTMKRNMVLVKDKCSYAHCGQTDTLAFCGGVESDYIISLEVCFFRLKDSACKLSFMNLQRIGCSPVFVQGQLFVFGGRIWGDSGNGSVIPYCRPLVLADNFEKCVEESGGKRSWELVQGMGGMPRCHSAAVSIDECAYLFGGYCNGDEISNSSTPKASTTVQVYDKTSDSWSKFPEMHCRRAECGAAVLRSYRIYVIGGMDNGNPVTVNEFLDIANMTWTMIKEEPRLPLGPASACLVGNSLYVAGQINRALVRLDAPEEEWKEVYQLPHLYEFIFPVTKPDIMRRHSTG